MTVWHRSDDHFGHRKVSELRGFPTPAHHNIALVERHNDLVRPDDIVWFHGDLSAGGSKATHEALHWIDLMHGRKRLIYGNHDPGHPMNRDAWKWQKTYLAHFESAQPFARVSIDETRALLSHFPYTADRNEQRYGQYRLRNEGMWLIHGHLHSKDTITSSREIHVGLDAWGLNPVSADQIKALMDVLE